MKYVKKIPSTDKILSDKLVSEGWTRLKEPTNLGIATLMSIPFMFINGFISMVISYNLYPPLKEFLSSMKGFNITLKVDLTILIYMAITLAFMTIHEFLHACFIPNILKSDKTFWGINGVFGFVFTTERIRKERFLVISIMPFIILTVILPFILSHFGLLNWFTIFLCILNAMGSCVDFLNICIVAFQIPRSAYIINNGFETYFK